MTETSEPEEYSSLELLADYECPECGPLVEPIHGYPYTEDEASVILGGDENGDMRCPECGEELQLTAVAAAAHLDWLSDWLSERLSKNKEVNDAGDPTGTSD